MLIDVEFTSMILHEICLKVEFIDLFDPNSQRTITKGLDLILTHGRRKLFSPTLLAVVEGIHFSPYIYVGRAVF
jgi:hypothetical protein